MRSAAAAASFTLLIASSAVLAAPLGSHNGAVPEKRGASQIMKDVGAAFRAPAYKLFGQGGRLLEKEESEVLAMTEKAPAPATSIGNVWKTGFITPGQSDAFRTLGRWVTAAQARVKAKTYTAADMQLLKAIAYEGNDVNTKELIEELPTEVRREYGIYTDMERKSNMIVAGGTVAGAVGGGTGAGIGVGAAAFKKHNKASAAADKSTTSEDAAGASSTDTPASAHVEARSIEDLD